MRTIVGRGVVGLLLVLLLGAPAAAIPEREPNDEKEQAMAVQPGVVIEGTFSRERANATRRAEDMDYYRLTHLISPGVYTITVTPALPDCRYAVSVETGARVVQGSTTVVWELTGQRSTRVTARYGNQPEERVSYGGEARELTISLANVSWSARFDRGFQCVKDGAWYREIPYRLAITAGSQPPVIVTPQPPVGGALSVVPEREPNNTKDEAMLVQPGTVVEGALVAGAQRGADTDTDWFRVALTSPGVYTITLRPARSDCDYWLGIPHLKRGRGQSSIVIELTGQRRTNYAFRLGGQPEERYSTLGEEPREVYILVEHQAWSADSQRGVQCVKDGPWYREIPYHLAITTGSQPPAIVMPPPPPPPGRPDQVPPEISLQPGTAWEGTIPATRTVELLARLAYDKPAGANWALEVWVNGQRLSAPLINKQATFRYADGRTFPYHEPSVPGWLLFYSPDFAANDTAAGGGYQVLTDPGQAYRYRWDISSLAGGSGPVRLRLYNNGRGANQPIVVRLQGLSVVLPPPASKSLQVLVRDEQGRPVAGAAVRIGVAGCAGDGTTDPGGVATVRLPAGCQ